MRLKIELISNENVGLPVEFNSNIQALIHNFLDKVDSNWPHEEELSLRREFLNNI